MYTANNIINAIIANTTITDTTTAAITPADVSSDGSIVVLFSNESKKVCNTSAKVKFSVASDLNSKGVTTKEYNKKGVG